MGHTHQNCRTWKYESHWEKWVTFGQTSQTLENELLFINMGQTHQNCRTLKYESHWAKWVRFFQKGQTLENESHCINMSYTDQNYRTWRYESQWAKWVTFDQWSEMREWVTLYKHVSHSSKLLHLEVRVTLGKMGLFWPNGSNLHCMK